MGEEYISGNAAKGILRATYYGLHRACLLGEVRIKAEVGATLKYHRGDVERLAEKLNRKPQPAGA